MQRIVHSFQSIPSLSNVVYTTAYCKKNLMENNKEINKEINKENNRENNRENKDHKQIYLNYGKFNKPTPLGFMSNIQFKNHFTPKEESTHSWLNMVGNLNGNRFKIYESCYFQKNPRAGYISLDYSLLYLDVITNEPFYSPVSQEISTKLKDKVNISLSLKYDIRQEDSTEMKYDNTIYDNFWVLLTDSTQENLNTIKKTLNDNIHKSVITDS